jgi:hypothetical protein
VAPDPICKNVNRHCLVSYDPVLYRNDQAIPFFWKGRKSEGGEKREGSSSNTTILQDFNTIGLPNYHTTPQPEYRQPRLDETKLAALRFQRRVEEKEPGHWKQYERLVERRHEARGGKRNETIIHAIPYLYRALSVSAVRLYMEWFYRMNAHVFGDPLQKHLEQVDSMLCGVAGTYVASLSTVERQYWAALNARDRDTFRIARDLALYAGPGAPSPPEFFLSGEALAIRLGLFRSDGRPQDEAGARSLRTLVQFEIVDILVVGRGRERGAAGIPTRYRWALPLH